MKTSNRLIALLLIAACTACGGGGSGNDVQIIDPPPTNSAQRVIEYGINDFTGIEINGSFVTTVTEAANYRVEITIDSTEASKLDVRRDGSNLSIGFLPGSDVRADTLRAVVQMPVLEELILIGSNNVETSGFSGSVLRVSSNGSNVLDSAGLEFDLIMADAFGDSLLDFTNISPAPGAHFELSGSTTAVINLMNSANVTGTLAGTSALSYYGSDIFFDLTLAPTASVTRLGDTR
ncbi:MAG: DUF2807 domain-containing protein [Gammaproteobacteria bacterium]|nr:DUF2807 domain-containing protein [Gammaproteobacteria bacterium]